jgi:hypothetical protein
VISQMIKPYVDNWLRTRQAVADLIFNFSTLVLMTDLGEGMLQIGSDLDERIELFNRTRNNRGALVLNKKTEDVKNVSASLGSGRDCLACGLCAQTLA